MGALGVGLATVASQWLSCLLVLFYLARAEGEYRLRVCRLRIGRGALLAILGAGIPAAAQSLLFNFSAVILQSAVNGFGPAVVAGNTAALNVEGYIYTTQNALYHTATMFIARERGSGNIVGIGRIKRAAAAIVTVIGLAVCWGVLLLASPILSLYAPGNPQAVQAGLIRLLAVCPLYFFCGLMEVGTDALRGMGRSLLPTVSSLIGCCLLRIVWVFADFSPVSPALSDGEALFLLYLCFPLSWLLTAIAQHVLEAREL
jgi:Na+-driven multidrug efflux pump